MSLDKKIALKPILIASAIWLSIGLFLLNIPADASTIETISPQLAAALVEKHQGSAGFAILDIRTPPEFQSGHLRGAVLIDYYAPSFADRLKQLDKSKTYLVYCRSGNRSGRSLAIFKQMGFQSVYNMARGINGWRQAGYAVTTAEK